MLFCYFQIWVCKSRSQENRKGSWGKQGRGALERGVGGQRYTEWEMGGALTGEGGGRQWVKVERWSRLRLFEKATRKHFISFLNNTHIYILCTRYLFLIEVISQGVKMLSRVVAYKKHLMRDMENLPSSVGQKHPRDSLPPPQQCGFPPFVL